jgi:AraC-like DNA-binding protein
MNVHVQSRTRARPAPATVRVERARAFLDEHVTERVSLETLAQVAGVSKYHFIRLFNRVIGESPHAYQVRRRIDLARTLLTQGLAASYVAQETGFSDHSHLIRTFRRFTGTTPTRFASGLPSPLPSVAFGPDEAVRAAS